MQSHPSEFKLIYSAEQISKAVTEVATGVSQWASQSSRHTGKDVVAVPILRGGIFFFADMLKQLDCSVEIAPIRSSVYEEHAAELQRAHAKVDLDGIDVRGRDVLLVDDLCDTGKTLAILKPLLLKEGAHEVKSAVLIQRMLEGKSQFSPDWAGLHFHGPEWFVGYGMDYCSRWRNLPEIYVIQKEQR